MKMLKRYLYEYDIFFIMLVIFGTLHARHEMWFLAIDQERATLDEKHTFLPYMHKPNKKPFSEYLLTPEDAQAKENMIRKYKENQSWKEEVKCNLFKQGTRGIIGLGVTLTLYQYGSNLLNEVKTNGLNVCIKNILQNPIYVWIFTGLATGFSIAGLYEAKALYKENEELKLNLIKKHFENRKLKHCLGKNLINTNNITRTPYNYCIENYEFIIKAQEENIAELHKQLAVLTKKYMHCIDKKIYEQEKQLLQQEIDQLQAQIQQYLMYPPDHEYFMDGSINNINNLRLAKLCASQWKTYAKACEGKLAQDKIRNLKDLTMLSKEINVLKIMHEQEKQIWQTQLASHINEIETLHKRLDEAKNINIELNDAGKGFQILFETNNDNIVRRFDMPNPDDNGIYNLFAATNLNNDD